MTWRRSRAGSPPLPGRRPGRRRQESPGRHLKARGEEVRAAPDVADRASASGERPQAFPARRRPPQQAPGPEVDAIRQLAIALAENELGADDDDMVMICKRITEPPAVPIADLRYDTCRWCEAEIYYDG